jgi:hypothetical protein
MDFGPGGKPVAQHARESRHNDEQLFLSLEVLPHPNLQLVPNNPGTEASQAPPRSSNHQALSNKLFTTTQKPCPPLPEIPPVSRPNGPYLSPHHQLSPCPPRAKFFLDIIELLEAVLLKLPLKDLIFAQKICKHFKRVIETSASLQKALFFQLGTIEDAAVDACLFEFEPRGVCRVKFNKMALNTLLCKPYSSPGYGEDNLRLYHFLVDPKATAATRKKYGKSWTPSYRRMYLSQPPVSGDVDFELEAVPGGGQDGLDEHELGDWLSAEVEDVVGDCVEYVGERMERRSGQRVRRAVLWLQGCCHGRSVGALPSNQDRLASGWWMRVVKGGVAAEGLLRCRIRTRGAAKPP